MNITKDTVNQWRKKHKKFSVAVDALFSIQGEMLQMHSLTGWYNPAITQLLLKNNHGFRDKKEIDHTSDGERIGGINYVTPTDPKRKAGQVEADNDNIDA